MNAGREFRHKDWGWSPKLALDAVTFSCTYRADCTSLNIKNTLLISAIILGEKSLTGPFLGQLNYSSKSHRSGIRKEAIIFKYKES